MLILTLANADINSRVASTIPFYYWAAAATIVEGKKKLSGMAILIAAHNVGYLLGNMFLFPTEIGFL
jgi:hypothetical protein